MKRSTSDLGRRFWLLYGGWLLLVGGYLIWLGRDGLSGEHWGATAIYLMIAWFFLGCVVGATFVPAIEELVAKLGRLIRRLRSSA